MIKWFAANNLVLNLDKTNIMKFITRNSAHSTLHIGYKEKNIEQTGLLCYKGNKAIYVFRCNENDLLFLYSLSYILWYYLLG